MNQKSSKLKLIIGCDHAGYALKQKILSYLKDEGYNITDAGCFSEDAVDYPVIAKDVANKVASKAFDKGILICGTGIGMSIAANKVKGIRAAVCSDTVSAKYSVRHNNANILCFGARIAGEYLAKDICDCWLNAEFEAERHAKRVAMLED